MPRYKEQRAGVRRGAWVPSSLWHMAQAQKSSRRRVLWLWSHKDKPLPAALPSAEWGLRTWNMFEGGGVPPGLPSPSPAFGGASCPGGTIAMTSGFSSLPFLHCSPLLHDVGCPQRVELLRTASESSNFPRELVGALIGFKPEQGEGPWRGWKGEGSLRGPRAAGWPRKWLVQVRGVVACSTPWLWGEREGVT